jgi:prophage regulatory protein
VTPTLHRIIQARDLPQYTGLAETRLKELVNSGEFPQPVKVSQRRNGWLESEIIAWQQARIAQRYRANGAPERDDTATPAQTSSPAGNQMVVEK